MIRVVRASPGEAKTEGILRSVNADLAADTPGSRALELDAGCSVTERLEAMGGLPVGAAVITPGGKLDTDFLIHVILQSQEEAVGSAGLRSGLLNGLRRAQEWSLKTLALQPLGVGAGNLELEESASVTVSVILEHCRQYEFPREVVITVASDYEEDVFIHAVEAGRRHASAREN